MLTKRIIPCLDIKNGRTVKGVNFTDLKDAGNPVELAIQYAQKGADELVFLDISATEERRKTLLPLVKEIAAAINIPFTVGGGITSIKDVSQLLRHGADKVCVNTAAIWDPALVTALAANFGSQCVVVAIDAKKTNGQWRVHIEGGKTPTNIDLFSWAIEAETLGAGEILFTSINNDGTKKGFANSALARLSEMLTIPLIASGGAGNIQDFVEVFTKGKADAALAASVFHYGEIEIGNLKRELNRNYIPIRL